jgi:indolepyruvate ferredoxin oxidoreductase beta subunit
MISNTSNTDVIDIVISGVGGQGVLTLAEILAKAALDEGHNVRVGEIHGMAQRGGHVVCTVRIGENALGPIVDPGSADLLVGFEPVETLREAHMVRKDGLVLMNSHIQYPVAVSMGKAEYPSNDSILKSIGNFSSRIIEIDAMAMAHEAGNALAMNMAMLGCIIGTGIAPISLETALKTVQSAFPKRFESINTKAVNLGFQKVKESKLSR